jgi:two-component system cell cycle sensor histidine kinase/response regulator CckA
MSVPIILLIEDDAAVRDVVCRLLKAHGYEVLAAESGEAALEIERTARVDLVVSDIILPGRDGFQVVAEIRRRSPHVSAFFISGQFDAAMAMTAGLAPNTPVLRKPFPLKELLRLVQEAVPPAKAVAVGADS